MATLGRTALAAMAFLAGSLLVSPPASAGLDQVPLAPCYNGVFPLNPYVDNCGMKPRPPRVIGSAPDATALLNCSIGSQAFRAQCLSLYVNGGMGWGGPGAVLAPGYHP